MYFSTAYCQKAMNVTTRIAKYLRLQSEENQSFWKNCQESPLKYLWLPTRLWQQFPGDLAAGSQSADCFVRQSFAVPASLLPLGLRFRGQMQLLRRPIVSFGYPLSRWQSRHFLCCNLPSSQRDWEGITGCNNNHQ